MRRGVRWAVSAVCLAAAVCIGISGSIMWKESRLTEMGVTMTAVTSTQILSQASGVNGITPRQARQIRETENKKEEPIDFTAWCEEDGERVTDTDGLRSAIVTRLGLSGNSINIIPYGKSLQETDEEGCLLGERAAWELFGSRDVEGHKIRWGGREFTVRGVLKEPEDVFIVQEPGEDTFLDKITLSHAQNTREIIRSFRDSYGLDRFVVTNDRQNVWEVFLDLVPGKWSDFEGWGANIEDRAGEREQSRRAAKSLIEVREEEHRHTALLLLALSGAFLVGALTAARGELEREKA